MVGSSSALAMSFNPRTPAGCDAIRDDPDARVILFQSTHPCGVRLEQLESLRSLAEFQSTHPCGVRRGTLGLTLDALRFNPRTPAGCDAWFLFCIGLYFRFQSTHPCGVRLHGAAVSSTHSKFQSTHPCGVRLILRLQVVSDSRGFNPRTPAGCDFVVNRWDYEGEVSIHAPLRGATSKARLFLATTPGFNPRTPAGCDKQ